MRGDSLRDLYAKTVALLGLGVLAGTGALVDYWPSGVVLPVVDAGLATPEVARSLPVPDRLPNLELASNVAPRPARETRPVVRVAAVEAKPADVVPRIPVRGLAEVDDALIEATMAEPPTSVPVMAASFTVDYSLGQEVSLTLPPARPLAAMAMGAPVARSSQEDEDGLLSGMVRRTGHTIVRGGRATGASIMGAFRFVSSAVRRALPN